MRKVLSAALVLVAACGTTPDQRPLTLEVVTIEVLAPTCGQVQCHSTTTRTENLAFDTIEASRESLIELDVDSTIPDFFGGELFEVLDGANGKERMPPDAPLADEDYDLLKAWVAAGTPNL